MANRSIFFARLVFAAVSLTVLFQLVPIAVIGDVLRDADPAWFAIGLVLQFFGRAAGTFRMRVVAANQGVPMRLWQLYRIALVSHFYAVLLPGPLVGGGAAWMKYLQSGASKGAAAAIVVVNRAIGLCIMFGLGAGAWVVDRYFGTLLAIVSVSALGILIAGILVLLPVQQFEHRLAPTGQATLNQRLARLWQRLFLFRQMSRSDKLVIVVSSFVQELIGAAVILAFARAVDAPVNLVSVLWIRAALLTVLMLPITVAGLGVREVSLVGLGALIGISSPVAIAWSLAILAGSLVVAVAGGLVEANAASRTLGGLLHGSPRDAVDKIRNQ